MLVDWKDLIKNATKAITALATGNGKIIEGIKSLDEAGATHGALDAKTRELKRK